MHEKRLKPALTQHKLKGYLVQGLGVESQRVH